MGLIGKGVKVCHLVGLLIVFSTCLYTFPFSYFSSTMTMVNAEDSYEKAGALTVVESTTDSIEDDGDGIVSEENEDEQTAELFEPTSDWKPVKKGQKIPNGLHVRLNLQTGEREAKLMNEPRKKGMNEWYAGEKIGTINTEKQRFTRDELKKALTDFKIDDAAPDSEKSEEMDSHAEDVKKKFRSYAELKDAMKQMKMSVKTEAEIVTELIGQLKEPEIGVENLKTLLMDMEYYLHQLDNARLFCDLDGMQVLAKLTNHTEEEIRTKSLLVLGSALQSNAKVQVTAIETGMMQQLLRIIAVDQSVQVKRKSLFALSTLLRQFPYAQRKFIDDGGLSAIRDLFTKSDDESLKIKIITLLTDLVQEKDLSSAQSYKNDETQTEKVRQYSEVKMRDALHKSGWCSRFESLLHQDSGHDNVEKVLTAMTILKDTCQDQFSSLRPTLKVLSNQYSNLAKLDKEQGETDTFFDNIHYNIEKLLKDIKFNREDL